MLPKSIVVATNGMFTMAGGKKRALAEGQVLNRDGRLTSPDGSVVPVADPDGRIVSPRNRTRRLLDGQILRLSESGVESTDTARIEKRKVVLFKDGGRLEFRAGQVMAMSDGSRIDASGTIAKRDGSRIALEEDELHKFSGAGDAR